ncbi:MAG: hypothetical protein AAF608_13705 [Pseudomonadota bacterium]
MTHSLRWPRRAVVDIGSNSVRLVIFSGPPRAPISIVNEKVLCGLGDRDPASGALRPEPFDRAIATLQRFRGILDAEDVQSEDVVATAAVRDASNGDAFLTATKRVGFDVRLISGDEEARLAGLGILCSAHEISRDSRPALGGDLGGGSLELSQLGGGGGAKVHETVSLPVGALRMLSEYGGDLAKVERAARTAFANVAWLKRTDFRSLYIVGGSWRALARISIQRTKHPIPVLDHYTVDRESMLETCRYAEIEDGEVIGRISGVQKKRVPTIPGAAVVLRCLIDQTSIEQVTVSACGVREGLLFDRLTDDERRSDPLFTLAEDLAERSEGGRLPDPDAITAFLDPLFDEPASLRRLRYTAAQLIRGASLAHPEQRARHAASLVMATPFLGLDHRERTILAVMILARFGGSLSKDVGDLPVSLLAEDDIRYAYRVGCALRLVTALNRPMFARDSGFRLQRTEETLSLTIEPQAIGLFAEAALKEFDRLSDVFDLRPEVLIPAHG